MAVSVLGFGWPGAAKFRSRLRRFGPDSARTGQAQRELGPDRARSALRRPPLLPTRGHRRSQPTCLGLCRASTFLMRRKRSGMAGTTPAMMELLQLGIEPVAQPVVDH